MKKLDVHIYTDTKVEKYEHNLVTTNADISFKTDTLIWAAGVAGQHPDGFISEEIGHGNRIIINEYCQMPNDNSIFILGDLAHLKTAEYPRGLPMLGSVAMQQGAYLAKYFNRKAKQKSVKKFRYKNKGTMATVGRNLAVADLKRSKLSGFLAWLVWMFVHLMLLVGFRNRLIVFINWTWNYFRYNNGLRLIIRPFKKQEDNL